MANVGDQLLQPEEGWKRYDNEDINIEYIGDTWTKFNGEPGDWMSSAISASGDQSYLQFGFNGSKLRIISILYSDHSPAIEIYVDGTLKATGDANGSIRRRIMICDITLDEFKYHTVMIKNRAGIFGKLPIDAVDIDETGELCPWVPEISKDYEFPVKTIEKADVEPYAASCVNGEEQLLIAIEDGSQYLTRGDGTYITCGVTQEKYNALEARILALEELLKTK